MKRIGFGQVEPNHLSAQRTGQIYAQLPMASDIAILENGQFVKYDYENNVVNYTGKGEWMLVFNEVKLYESRMGNKDFALKAENCVGGAAYPRVFKTNVGDIYTTNCIGVPESEVDVEVGNIYIPGEAGFLVPGTLSSEGMKWQAVKVYTLADGQTAVKLMRIA